MLPQWGDLRVRRLPLPLPRVSLVTFVKSLQLPEFPFPIKDRWSLSSEIWEFFSCPDLLFAFLSPPDLQTPILLFMQSPKRKEGKKPGRKTVCSIPNLNPKKKEQLFKLMNFRSFSSVWPFPVLAALSYCLGTLPLDWYLDILCKGHWISQLCGKLCAVIEGREGKIYEYTLSSLQHSQHIVSIT